MCLQGKVAQKNNRRRLRVGGVWANQYAASGAAATSDTEMSVRGVGWEELLKWDVQRCSRQSAAHSAGAAAHWTFRVSTSDRNYRIHGNCELSTDFSFYRSRPGQIRLQRNRMVLVSRSLFSFWLQNKLRSTFLDTHHDLVTHTESTARIMATHIMRKPNFFLVSLYPSKIRIVFLKMDIIFPKDIWGTIDSV